MASKKNKKNKKIINESVPAENANVNTETELISEEEYFEDIISESKEIEREVTEPETAEEAEKTAVEEAAEVPEEPEKPVDTLAAPYLVRLVVVLTCICTVIALLLSVVNAVTEDVIIENQEREKQEAILAVFPAGDTVKEYTTADGEIVYIILRDNEIIGYTVSVSAGGYVGPVDMMIGMTPEGAVDGVKIVSMGETPGVGTKISAESFLSQFKGMDSKVVFGENADAVTGATFSSRAVEEAVNYAIALDVDLADAAAQLNAKLTVSDGKIDDFQDANEDNGDSEINIGEAVVEGEEQIETEPAETEPEETVPETVETEPQETETTAVETVPEIPVVAEPEIPAEPETETPAVVVPEIPVVTEPEIPEETEPEVPAWTEQPAETEPEVPAWTEPPAETEPEVPAWTEAPAVTEPEVPEESEIPAETEPEIPAESVEEENSDEESSETTGEEPAEPSEETEPPIEIEPEVTDEPEETEESEESEESEENEEETKKSSNKGGFIFN